MSNIYTIPNYIPESLRVHVEPLIKYDEDKKVIYPLERLISSLTMKDVWDKLVTICLSKTTTENEKKVHDAQHLINFVVFVNSHASLSGKVDDYITEPSDNLQREAYLSVQKDLESIIATLQSLSEVRVPRKDVNATTLFKQGSIQEGWHILEGAVHRCEITTLKSNKIEEPKQLAELISALNSINEQHNVQDILETMTFASIAASQAKDSNLPKRRNTSKAKINSFILDLSDYFINQFKRPFDDLVAITTNVAFDFSDERVTQDTVYKLRNPPKPKLKSKISK